MVSLQLPDAFGTHIRQFQLWLDEAIAAKLSLPEAMNLATATPEGSPSSRMVLLKQVDRDGFVFFSNYHSAKAAQLEANPYAALVFYWPQFERQVRVEGKVERTSAEESEVYFQTRPRESQIGAWASPQSSVIADRDVLEQRARELEEYLRSNVQGTGAAIVCVLIELSFGKAGWDGCTIEYSTRASV